jgi:autotransporter-associated beta strand protein
LAATSDVSGARLESKGGFIETSGQYLTADGVSIQAATWLIDPVDIEINSSGTPTQTAYSQISNQTINAALNGGSSVVVSTAGSGASSAGGLTAGTSTGGNILVSGAIAKTAGGNATLSLTADNNITINQSISSSSGTLGLNLTVPGVLSGTGNITLNGGNLNILNGAASVYDGAITTHYSNAWTTSVTTKSGAGSLKIRGKSLLGTLNVNQGTFTISNEIWADQTAPTTSAIVNIASGATLEYFTAAGTTLDLFPATPYGSNGSSTYNGAGTLLKSGAGSLMWGPGAGTFNLSSGGLINVQGGFFTGSSSANESWANNLGSLNVASGANFSTVEGNVRVDGLTGAGTVTVGYASYFPNAGLTIGVAGNALGTSTFSGSIVDFTGYNGKIIKEGSGTQILSGNNTYTGTTTVNGGTLQIGSGGASGTLGNGGAVSVASGANLNLFRSDSLTVSNAISGAGTVNFLGTGTAGQSQYALTGNNSGLTGRINISSSRLAVRAAIVSGDTVNFANSSATFDTKNVGTGKTVSVSGITIAGTDAANYSLQNTTASTSADVTAKAATVTGTATSTTYNGLTQNQTAATSSGFITGDVITIGVADVVVARGQAAGHQGACVGACAHVGAGVGAGDVQGAAQHGARLAVDQPAVAHAAVAGGVRLGHELGIGIGRHGQVGLGDGAAGRGGADGVVVAAVAVVDGVAAVDLQG